MIEHQDVFGDWRARQRALGRRHRQRRLQRADGGKIEIGVTPLDELHRLECVGFERLHQFGLERWATAAGAEGAVAGGASGAAGNLRKFGGVELAELITVEFTIRCERNMIDIEIESHADRVGRHQIIDLARLIELDLRVARARR